MFNSKTLRHDLSFAKQQNEQLRLELQEKTIEILKLRGLSQYKVYVDNGKTHEWANKYDHRIISAKTIRRKENSTIFLDENGLLVASYYMPVIIEKIR